MYYIKDIQHHPSIIQENANIMNRIYCGFHSPLLLLHLPFLLLMYQNTYCYTNYTLLYLSIPLASFLAHTLAWLTECSIWMTDHHLQLDPSKTELLVILASPLIQHNNIVKLGSVLLLLSRPFRSLGVSIDDQLVYTDHSNLLILQVCFI